VILAVLWMTFQILFPVACGMHALFLWLFFYKFCKQQEFPTGLCINFWFDLHLCLSIIIISLLLWRADYLRTDTLHDKKSTEYNCDVLHYQHVCKHRLTNTVSHIVCRYVHSLSTY
jgi:hypothetical protein